MIDKGDKMRACKYTFTIIITSILILSFSFTTPPTVGSIAPVPDQFIAEIFPNSTLSLQLTHTNTIISFNATDFPNKIGIDFDANYTIYNFEGLLLDFIDYTSQFKTAMRNWKNKVRPGAVFIKNNAQIAEEMVKRYLRYEDKDWAIDIYSPFEDVLNLFLRVGHKNEFEPLSHFGGYHLTFSEGLNDDDVNYATSLSYHSNPPDPPLICLLRQIEGRPLKLKELYEKEKSKNFW